MSSFVNTWDYVQSNLRLGQSVDVWTNEDGYTKDRFTVQSVTPNAMLIDIPEGKNVERVPRGEFERVYGVWSQYKDDAYSTDHIRENISEHTDYVVSVLRWVESNNDGNLP